MVGYLVGWLVWVFGFLVVAVMVVEVVLVVVDVDGCSCGGLEQHILTLSVLVDAAASNHSGCYCYRLWCSGGGDGAGGGGHREKQETPETQPEKSSRMTKNKDKPDGEAGTASWNHRGPEKPKT